MSEPLVRVRGLKKSFHKDGATVSVLKGIDFEAGEGEFVTIMGPSGAGKTTFLHIIGSLDRPTEGHVFYRGKDVSLYTGEEQCRFRNEKVGYVFQFYHLLQDFTVLENIMMPLWIKRVKPGRPSQPGKNSCASWVWPIEERTSRASCQGASSREWLSQGRLSTGRR